MYSIFFHLLNKIQGATGGSQSCGAMFGIMKGPGPSGGPRVKLEGHLNGFGGHFTRSPLAFRVVRYTRPGR